jgi:hypothetical protein
MGEGSYITLLIIHDLGLNRENVERSPWISVNLDFQACRIRISARDSFKVRNRCRKIGPKGAAIHRYLARSDIGHSEATKAVFAKEEITVDRPRLEDGVSRSACTLTFHLHGWPGRVIHRPKPPPTINQDDKPRRAQPSWPGGLPLTPCDGRHHETCFSLGKGRPPRLLEAKKQDPEAWLRAEG